jgi:hypothetical protein
MNLDTLIPYLEVAIICKRRMQMGIRSLNVFPTMKVDKKKNR